MSGIINSAGSKSGLIGTKELDYEEGTWTPSHNNAHSNNTGTYKKIGKKVFLEGWFYTNGGSSGTVFSGLPFTAVSHGNSAGGGGTNYQNNSVNDEQYGIQVSGTTFYFYKNATAVDFANGKQSGFHLSYTTA